MPQWELDEEGVPPSNRTVWRTRVPVSSACHGRRQVMEYANLGETDPIVTIAVL
jgi:hypothetical protein